MSSESLRYKDLPVEWKRVSTLRGVRDIWLVWGAIFGTAFVLSLNWHPLLIPIAIILIGGLQNHISSLIHHAIHWNIYPDHAFNDWLARLFLSAPQGQLFQAMRNEHLGHHRDLGAADDPERFYYDLKRHGRTTVTGFVTWLSWIFMGWVILPMISRWVTGQRGDGAPEVPENTPRAKRARSAPRKGMALDIALVLPVQTALFALFWLVTDTWWGYFVCWALPLVTFGAGLNVLRATIEHANPDEQATAEDPHDILFSFVSNPVERFFVSPFHFNYHYEHHRFMNIPYYHTPKLRKILIDSHDYEDVTLVPSYVGRVIDICRRLRDRARIAASSPDQPKVD